MKKKADASPSGLLLRCVLWSTTNDPRTAQKNNAVIAALLEAASALVAKAKAAKKCTVRFKVTMHASVKLVCITSVCKANDGIVRLAIPRLLFMVYAYGCEAKVRWCLAIPDHGSCLWLRDCTRFSIWNSNPKMKSRVVVHVNYAHKHILTA